MGQLRGRGREGGTSQTQAVATAARPRPPAPLAWLGVSSSAHGLSQTDPRVFPDVRCG